MIEVLFIPKASGRVLHRLDLGEELWQWAAALHHRFGGRPVAVALEQSSGALVYQLSQYPHLWLYPGP